MTDEEIEELNARMLRGKLTLIVCDRVPKHEAAAGPKYKCMACKTKFEGPDAQLRYKEHECPTKR